MFERENQMRRSANLNNEMPSVMRVKFFRTLAGPDDTPYPEEAEEAEENPNVYYAVMLINPTFTNEVGRQALFSSTSEKKVHIFNLEPRNYIEEDSIVLGWEINNRWWTIDKVPSELVIVHLTEIDLSTGELIFQTNQITTREYIDSDGTDVSGRADLANLGHVADGVTGELRWTNSPEGRNLVYRGDGFLAQSLGTIVKKINPTDGESIVVDDWPLTLPGSTAVGGLAADRNNAGGVYAMQALEFSQLDAEGLITHQATASATSLILNGTVMRHMDAGGMLALNSARPASSGPFFPGLAFVSDSALKAIGSAESASQHTAFTADGDYYVRAYGSGNNVNDFDVVVNRVAATLDWSKDDALSASIIHMCHDPNGGFYAIDTSGRLSRFDSSGNLSWTRSSGVQTDGISSLIADANGVAVGIGGGSTFNQQVRCYDTGGNLTATSTAGGGNNRYFGMDESHVYYPHSGTVAKLHRTNGTITVFPNPAGPSRTIAHVIVGGGSVYASTGFFTAAVTTYKFSTGGTEDNSGWPLTGTTPVNGLGWNSANNYLCVQYFSSPIVQYDSSGTARLAFHSPGAAGPVRMKLDQYSKITSSGLWQNQEGAYFEFTPSGHIVPVFKMLGEGLGNRTGVVDASCYNPVDDAYYSGGGGTISKVTVSRAEHVVHLDPRDGLTRAPIHSVALSPDKTKVLVHLSVASSGDYGKVVCFSIGGSKLWSSEGVGLASVSNRGTVTSTPDHAFVWHTPVLSVL